MSMRKVKQFYTVFAIIAICLIISIADSINLRLKYGKALSMAKKCEIIAYKNHVDTNQRINKERKDLSKNDKEFLKDFENKVIENENLP